MTTTPKEPAAEPGGYNQKSGMTQTHFALFQEIATKEQRILVVRNTKTASIPLIELGCPGKPKELEPLNGDESTGIVTTDDPKKIELARSLGYLVVERGGKVAKGADGKEVVLKNPFWKVAAGQVIDPKLMKPVVGDYDFMAVIDPNNPGQVIAQITEDGKLVENFTNPDFERIAARLNSRMDQKRVKHGPHELYGGFRGGCTVFLPGTLETDPNSQRVVAKGGWSLLLADEFAVEGFFRLMGRKTLTWRQDMARVPRKKSARVISGRKLVSLGRKVAQARVQGVLRSQDAMEFVAVLMGDLAQSIGDSIVRSQIQDELTSKHAIEIAEITSRGEGVLVIISMAEWLQPWETGHRSRRLVGVYIHAGPTQESALQTWLGTDHLLHGTHKREQRYEEYLWIDPNL